MATHFQQNVLARYSAGLVGESMFDQPRVSKTWRLDPTDTTHTPAVGLACTYKQDNDPASNVGYGDVMIAQIGTPAAATPAKFAGIIALPKRYQLNGTAAGTLEPTLNLRPGDLVELLTEGNVVLQFATATLYGEKVYFKAADGTAAVLAGTSPSGGTPGAGWCEIPGAFILTPDGTAAAGPSLVQLNGSVNVPAGT